LLPLHFPFGEEIEFLFGPLGLEVIQVALAFFAIVIQESIGSIDLGEYFKKSTTFWSGRK